MSVKKVISEISARSKYVRGKKGKLEKPYRKLKSKQPKGKAGKVARVAGLAGIDLSWFLFCLGKYTVKDLNTILLDNKIIDKLKDKHTGLQIKDTDSGFKQFFKKLEKSHPYAASRLKLWMLYGLLTVVSVGGIKMARHDKDADVKQTKKEQVIDDKEKNNDNSTIMYNTDDNDNNKEKQINNSAEEINNGDNKIDNNIIRYNIDNETFGKKFIDDNWNDVVICLLEFETWRDRATLHSGESRYTYGPGLTWVYIKQKNKQGNWNVVQHSCTGKYINIASNFSMAEKWEQARYHSEKETMPVMKRQLLQYGFTKITDQQALGLFVAGYQLPGSLSDNYNKKGVLISEGIAHKLSRAGSNKQKQVDAFIAGAEVPEKWRPGTNKRRWWCAMIYMGYITPDDLIDMDRDAFSSINVNTVLKNGHFVYDAATVEYVLEHAKNRNRGSVRKFINDRNVPLKGALAKHTKNNLDNNESNPSMVKANEGLKAFKAKDYQKAIDCYQAAVSLDADNMEAYSSLALSYKKLGDQTHSISDYEKVLEVVKACNAQMNKNKSLLHDPDVKASTYYNAGLAREEIAKLQEKNNNITEAMENYRMAKLNFETAYANAEEINNTERMEIYKEAQNRIDMAVETLKSKDNMNNKVDAFKKGKTNIFKKLSRPFVRDAEKSI